MSDLEWIVVVSGILLALLCVLLIVERRRSRRLVLPAARAWLDERLAVLFFRVSHISISFGSGTIRIATLYLIHRFLAILMKGLKLIEQGIVKLQTRNRQIARSVRAEQDKTHLDLIAENKKTVSLTEREKRQLKKQWLG